VYRAAKHGISTQQTSDKGVVMPFFTGRRRMFEEQHGGFVHERKEAEVAGMLARGFIDEEAFRS
jgi:hypothetical protein